MEHKINLEALHYYLSYGYIPAPLTIFEGISKRTPVDFSHLKWAPVHTLSEEEIIDRLDEMFQKSIKNNFDGKTGIFLGNIDSSLIVAMGAKILPAPLHTFTLTYTGTLETEYNRRQKESARQVSEIYKTNHHEVTICPDILITTLPEILKCLGEPYADVPLIFYFAAQAASPYINKLITGGYTKDLLAGIIYPHLISILTDEPWEVEYKNFTVFSDEEKQNLYNNEIYKLVQNYSTIEHLKKYCTDLTADDPLNKILELRFRKRRSLINELVTSHSSVIYKVVTTYSTPLSPYSSEEFVQFSAKIPGELKVREGKTKYILKKLAMRYLPEEIIDLEEWDILPVPDTLCGLEQYARQKLSPANLNKHKFFNVKYVQELIGEFYKMKVHTWVLARKIWTLLMFQIWYDGVIE